MWKVSVSRGPKSIPVTGLSTVEIRLCRLGKNGRRVDDVVVNLVVEVDEVLRGMRQQTLPVPQMLKDLK